MKGIVWGSTIERAERQLQQIIENYRIIGYTIDTYRKGKTQLNVLFNNGDYWIALGASESARGHCCNISYIDTLIDAQIIDDVIRHCTRAYPYNALRYFG